MSEQNEGDIGDRAKESYSTHKDLEEARSQTNKEKAETDASLARVIKQNKGNVGQYLRSKSALNYERAREANDAADAHLWRAQQYEREHLDEYIAEAKKDVDSPDGNSESATGQTD